MIHILTDSCADLDQELLDAFGIRSIPLHVLIGGEDCRDGTLTLEELFASVEQTNQLPRTSAPSFLEFSNSFQLDGPTIYVGLSSTLSATMQNAQLAKEHIKKSNLYLIDSLNLSTGIGLLALKAADLRDAGNEPDRIVEEISAMRPRVKTAFMIDTMDYLYKGGRCTGLQAFVGSMLKIRPIIHVQTDGRLGVLDKVRGSRKKALDVLLSKFANDLPQVDLTRVFVTHTICPEDANYLVEEIKKLAPVENVYITEAGATIASHCGPDTIGILYINN